MPWVSKVARSSALSSCGMALMKVVFAGPSIPSTFRARAQRVMSCRLVKMPMDCVPPARNTLSLGGIASAISCQLSKLRQSSPSSGCHGGRSSRRHGMFRDAATARALRVIWRAKGWVASINSPTPLSRQYSASPSGPPKPPTRVGTGNPAGFGVAPAREAVSWTDGSSERAWITARDSAVPASTSVLSGISDITLRPCRWCRHGQEAGRHG